MIFLKFVIWNIYLLQYHLKFQLINLTLNIKWSLWGCFFIHVSCSLNMSFSKCDVVIIYLCCYSAVKMFESKFKDQMLNVWMNKTMFWKLLMLWNWFDIFTFIIISVTALRLYDQKKTHIANLYLLLVDSSEWFLCKKSIFGV